MDNKKTCYKTTNNKYFNCPPRMSDGRHFTDYRSNVYVNDLIKYSNKTGSNYEYRQFLIHNAGNLMKMNNDYTNYMNGCSECNAQPVPFQTECFINQNYSNCFMKDDNGVGLYNKASMIQDNQANVNLGKVTTESHGQPKESMLPGYEPYSPLFNSCGSKI